MTLDQLEAWFKSYEIPETIQLDKCAKVLNTRKLIDTSISFLRSHSGNKGYLPYYYRLLKLKKQIDNEKI